MTSNSYQELPGPDGWPTVGYGLSSRSTIARALTILAVLGLTAFTSAYVARRQTLHEMMKTLLVDQPMEKHEYNSQMDLHRYGEPMSAMAVPKPSSSHHYGPLPNSGEYKSPMNERQYNSLQDAEQKRVMNKLSKITNTQYQGEEALRANYDLSSFCQELKRYDVCKYSDEYSDLPAHYATLCYECCAKGLF